MTLHIEIDAGHILIILAWLGTLGTMWYYRHGPGAPPGAPGSSPAPDPDA